jgi:hypothetical protein
LADSLLATGTPIKIVDNMPFDEFVKTLPEDTPPHIIEDFGIDIWKALDQVGCKYPCFFITLMSNIVLQLIMSF